MTETQSVSATNEEQLVMSEIATTFREIANRIDDGMRLSDPRLRNALEEAIRALRQTLDQERARSSGASDVTSDAE